jgi:hypothetical protein
MFRILSVVITTVLLIAALPAIAQDAVDFCDEDRYDEIADELQLLVDEFRESDTPADALRQIEELVSTVRTECYGLTFTSEQEGMQPVIGPVSIPEGLYRATATTTGFMIAEVDPLEGQCSARGFGSLFNLSRDTAIDGAQAVFESSGCEALIAISNTREPWTLKFEKLR